MIELRDTYGKPLSWPEDRGPRGPHPGPQTVNIVPPFKNCEIVFVIPAGETFQRHEVVGMAISADGTFQPIVSILGKPYRVFDKWPKAEIRLESIGDCLRRHDLEFESLNRIMNASSRIATIRIGESNALRSKVDALQHKIKRLERRLAKLTAPPTEPPASSNT